MSKERLKSLAATVSDSYTDFVEGLPVFAVKHGFVDEMIDFIEQNPNARTDEILEHLDMLEGYPEPFPIIDD